MHNLQKNFVDAMQRQIPAQVPVWELEFHAWQHFSKDTFYMGSEFAKLDSAAKEKALQQNAAIMAQVSEQLHFSAVTVPGSYWEVAPGHAAYWWLPDEYRLRQIAALQKTAPDLLLVANSGGVLAMPDAHEYIEFSIKMFEAPQEIDERAQQTLQAGLAMAQKLADVGVGAVYTASDIADNHGPYFNPEQMQRFILPYLQTWAKTVNELGLFAILHTDGDVTPYLQEITDSGIQALQAIDPVAGMHIQQVQQQIGSKICLCGNVDCGLFLAGQPQEIYAATTELLRNCSSNGSLVLGASNAVEASVKAENYMAMVRAWEDFYNFA